MVVLGDGGDRCDCGGSLLVVIVVIVVLGYGGRG